VIHTYIYIYEIYNAQHSRVWLESEARAVARWQGLGRNGREVECFNLRLNVLMVRAFLTERVMEFTCHVTYCNQHSAERSLLYAHYHHVKTHLALQIILLLHSFTPCCCSHLLIPSSLYSQTTTWDRLCAHCFLFLDYFLQSRPGTVNN